MTHASKTSPTRLAFLSFLVAVLSGTCTLVSANAEPVAEAVTLPENLLQLRDPFKRPIFHVEGDEAKTALQSFALTSMKMTGILTGPLRMRAMILTPDGKTHFVSENMPIGQRNGVIRKITEDRIYVRERIANILGQTDNIDTEIPLSSAKSAVVGSEETTNND